MPPLHAGEIVLSVFEPDLNGALQFSASTLLLTSERMISDSGGAGWTSWPLKAALSLHHSDHAGVGTLALHDGQDCVMRWRFTLAIDVAAVRLMQQFEKAQAHRIDEPAADEGAPRCPSCQSPLAEDSEECPLCHRELLQPASTWVLFRLWRFARPYKM